MKFNLAPRAAWRALTLLALITLLGACGFHLRGTGPGPDIPPEWQKLYLNIPNPNGEFASEFRNALTATGVELVERYEANYRLYVGHDQFSQRNLSVNVQARASEFELTLTTEFAVQDDEGNEVIPSTESTVIKQMENDPRNVVGKAEEIRILRGEMRTELVQQIIRRIAFFAGANA